MPSRRAPRIALAPSDAPGWMADAVRQGGGHLVEPSEAEALVWGAPQDGAALSTVLQRAPGARWVQLPWAGVEHFVDVVDGERLWTCGKGVYAEPVAELALTLALAGLRNLGPYARARRWTGPAGTNLAGARVTILGGGGITEALVRFLVPFDAHLTVVRNRLEPLDGVDVVVGSDRLYEALPGSDVVVLALALTPDTDAIIGAPELAMMEPHAVLVNVARGRHVVTDELVDALRDGGATSDGIGAAGLDVTDPEPLPDGHPLWDLPNCIVTPHVGNTPAMAQPLLSLRIAENVRRFADGEPLLGPIDPELGY